MTDDTTCLSEEIATKRGRKPDPPPGDYVDAVERLYEQRDQTAVPVGQVADELDVSRRTAQRWLRRLTEQGALTREPGFPNYYYKPTSA